MSMNAFHCPVCGMTSVHPTDVKQGYCGNCHAWTGPPYMVTSGLVVGKLNSSDLAAAVCELTDQLLPMPAGMSRLGAMVSAIRVLMDRLSPEERLRALQTLAVAYQGADTQVCGHCFTGYPTPELAGECARRCRERAHPADETPSQCFAQTVEALQRWEEHKSHYGVTNQTAVHVPHLHGIHLDACSEVECHALQGRICTYCGGQPCRVRLLEPHTGRSDGGDVYPYGRPPGPDPQLDADLLDEDRAERSHRLGLDPGAIPHRLDVGCAVVGHTHSEYEPCQP